MGHKQSMAWWGRWGAAVALLLGAGCSSEDFPGAPSGAAGERDVPYVTTYNFGFPVRFDPVTGADGNLVIISGGDLLNLVSAANITQRDGYGVVGGRVFSTGNGSGFITTVPDVVITATDVDGRKLGDFFYNNLGGTPDFVQTRGTTASGGFTAFNIPPGEVFLKAVSGGRGGVRLVAYPNEVSLGVLSVFPVIVPIIGVTGEITDELGRAIPNGDLTIDVLGQALSEAGNCNDESPSQTSVESVAAPQKTGFRFCIASDGDYFARFSGDSAETPARFVTTYHPFQTGTAEIVTTQATDVTEFFSVQTRAGIETATSVGKVSWDESSTGAIAGRIQADVGNVRGNAIIKVTDEHGVDLALPNVSVPGKGTIWYLNESGAPIADAQATGGTGRFLIINLPVRESGTGTGTVYLSVTAQVPTDGKPDRYAGTAISPVFRGGVVYQPLTVTMEPVSVTGEEDRDRYLTGPLSGRVMAEDGLKAVPGARVTPLGVPQSDVPQLTEQVFVAGADGAYDIGVPLGDPTAKTPLLGASTYLMKVAGPAENDSYLPTYQRAKTGSVVLDTGGAITKAVQDLTVVPRSTIEAFYSQTGHTDADPLDLTKGILYGSALDKGTKRPTDGIVLRAISLPGGNPIPVYYFDFIGVPRSASVLGATTTDGRFIIFNVPPGTASIDVVSPDDTGNVVADSIAGGVTLLSMKVNNAPPETVEVSGALTSLDGQGLSDKPVLLTAVGGDPLPQKTECPHDPPGLIERQGLCYVDPKTGTGIDKVPIPCETTYGPSRTDLDGSGYCVPRYQSVPASFTALFGSRSNLVMRTSGGGYLDTYTFGVATGDHGVNNVSVGVMTAAEIDRLASAAGSTRVSGTGVIWGQTTTASLGEVDATGNVSPLTCDLWTEIVNDTVKTLGCAGLGKPGAVATGPFNADGFRDLAVIDTTPTDPGVTIWLNDGTGSFVRSQRIGRKVPCAVGEADCGVEEGPVALRVMDVDGDGLADLVVLNQVSRSVSILKGRGRGKFVFGSSVVVTPDGTRPNTMASADFNRDNLEDLFITDGDSGRVALLLGNGTGFQPFRPSLTQIRVGTNPRAAASGFLDSDFIPDLVFANQDTVAVMQRIGVTNTLRTYSVPGTPDLSAVAIGDLDGDGLNDVVVTDRQDPPRVWVFLNSPSGLLTPTSLPAGPNPSAVALIDVNRDRTLDLVVVNAGDGTVLYRPGEGDGTFGAQLIVAVTGQPSTLVLDDVTGDGLVDAVLADSSGRMMILPQTVRPIGGITVVAAQENGSASGEVVYLDDSSSGVASGAAATTASGRFMILNVRPGPIWLRLLSGGTGSRFLQSYPDGVTNTTFEIISGAT
ncbi:MAG: VCBS repeat-containing protein, partial [Nitrospirae bacterium]|nr:VCBS repeat-containing protein [Nitrospirota bacterium]